MAFELARELRIYTRLLIDIIKATRQFGKPERTTMLSLLDSIERLMSAAEVAKVDIAGPCE